MINPQPEFEIVRAGSGDLSAIDRMEREAFKTPWSRDLLRAALQNDAYRVRVLRTATEGVLGFSIAHALGERSNLDNLVVDRSMRSRGYGSQLLLDWIEDAHEQELARVTLQVNTANVRAQKLYETFSFTARKLLVAYYPNGDDAYQMERSIAVAPELEPAPGSRRYWLRPRARAFAGRR
jgi:ribosomal-protein-alanine N-acetyltransferase